MSSSVIRDWTKGLLASKSHPAKKTLLERAETQILEKLRWNDVLLQNEGQGQDLLKQTVKFGFKNHF